MATSLEFPPFDYSLLFPDLLNFHMERNSYSPIFIYASESVPGTLVEISFLEFGRAAHRVAHALRPAHQGIDGEVVMIIANTDSVLYHAVFAGLMVAGWVPFPVSPRNSAMAVANMMKNTNCSSIVALDHARNELIGGIRRETEDTNLTVYELPSLRYVFPKLGKEVLTDAFVPYSPLLNRPDLDSPAIYIHSSGSTGFPKPIAHSHRLQIQWLAHPRNNLFRNLPLPRCIGSMAAPPFHVFGVVSQLYIPVACLVASVVYPPRSELDPLALPVVPTSDNIIEYLKKKQCNIFWTVPTFLEQMATSKEAINVLKTIDAVRFGGGPLAIKVGNALWAAGVRLHIGYGATEFGVDVTAVGEQDLADGDWMWMRFPEDIKVRWAPQGEGMYELQVLSTEDSQTAVENLPDVRGYATSDIFVKHPTKEMWKIVGRTDDVITLASGEKTVPVPMESIIGSSPLVQGVIMFGRGRNQVGVLIEPRQGHAIDVKDDKVVAEFRNKLWSLIEEANSSSPTFSRIFKHMILITSENKPMLRAGKGTVQRKGTLSAYEAEINALYDAAEAGLEYADGSIGPSAWTSNALEKWLLEHARSISPKNRVDPHADLFAQGFDSLSATYLRTRILGALRRSTNQDIENVAALIPLNVVFENPTIQLLSSRIDALVNGNSSAQAIGSTEQRKLAISAMIKKYSSGLAGPDDGILPSSPLLEPIVVLLTGSTGGLGSFLLSELLTSPAVLRVFAFNRPSAKQIDERQRSAFNERGLLVDLLASNKLVYVEADASLEKCGLSTRQYEEIRDSVTLIIHNAWRLDFNLALSSFDEHIQASRNLINLGLESPHKDDLRFLFTSSIGSAQSWDNMKGSFPEDVQLDPSWAIGTGYGESKYVSERIILKSGLHATSLRIGQIVGGPGGTWVTSDWFPILVISSITLGALPEAVEAVSWLRLEDVASAILEMAFSKEAPPSVLNIVNPRSVPWTTIIACVRRSIIAQKGLAPDALPTIPFGRWFALLESKAEHPSRADMSAIPAIKLVEFFRVMSQLDGVRMTNFSTTKAQQISSAMANMPAIGEAEVDAWVAYWISKGAF